MARVNVYLPDELARRAREAGLNVSRLTQEALEIALRASALQEWLDRVAADPPLPAVPDDVLRRALDEAKDELGAWPRD
jgi:hypothetical protein